MPTHSLLPFVESPDGLGQDILISGSASMPGPGSSMTPHSTASEKVLQTGEKVPVSCMFCEQTFTFQEELGPHVLTQHPTTLFEPSVLRVEAEFRIPGDRTRPKPSSLISETEEVFSCIVCGQVSQDASELENHLRKHKDYFTYCCNVCGRRFREPWFLKNHMKMHGNKVGAKIKAQQDLETPVTVNGVIQEQPLDAVITIYKMCMVCGFFFPDQDSLAEHSKIHNREVESGRDITETEDVNAESSVEQESFLQSLKLRPCCSGIKAQPERSSRWIAQLDPFNTYQAWQLATKGKIAVVPNNAKDIVHDASTDNEDCGSDKEELSNIWPEGQADKPINKEALGKELRPRQSTVETSSPEPDQRPLMQKDKDKERPTTCEDCGRSFRTYHQLVLHSRVHKRERGEESPTASVDGKLSRAGSLDNAEDGSEDGSEGTAVSESIGSGEYCFERSKVKPRQCSYCGKSFRSSYYLTVHLRTHTGEKPYKCAYCDYAAAQKTSLKYHIDRRHKDKPYVEIPCRPVPLLPSPGGKVLNNNEKSRAKLWVPGPKACLVGKPENRFDSIDKPPTEMNPEHKKCIAKPAFSVTADVGIKCPLPVNLKMEPDEVKEEGFEAPLNLSLKLSISISASSDLKHALTPIACASCTFKTLYPEVLSMHNKLLHKDKPDVPTRNGCRVGLKPKRLTGCPPALDGNDVTPLPMIDRSHPRRTKSPTPQAAKPQEKTPSATQPNVPKHSPIQVPRQDVVQEAHRYRPHMDVSQDSPRFTDVMQKPSTSAKYVIDRPSLSDRVGIGKRSYPMRSGVIWHSDAARMCLSRRFGTLPQMDLTEPSSKRLKYSMPTGRESDTMDKPGFRIPSVDGSNRLLGTGRVMKSTSQGPSTSTASEAGVKASAPGVGGNTDWNMINILRSCTPGDLASLYHSTATHPSHGGLANLRAGNRSTLYPHLPALPNLQRRDHSGPFPNERYGATDKGI